MAEEELNIEHVDLGGGRVLFDLRGSLDIASSPELRERLIALIERGASEIVIDLTHVGFIDSTGLGALIGANRRAGERGIALHLIVPEGPISRLLTVTGLIRVFAVHHTREGVAPASGPASGAP